MSAQENLWTIKETAAYLKMSTSWVYKRVSAGEIPHAKLGSVVRFVPEQVRQFAEQAPAPQGAKVIPLRQPGQGRR